VFVLEWPRAELAARIERRVDQMFAAGLVEEVRRLAAGPRPLGKTARQAVGYREVLEHLQGVRGLAETVELVKTHSRQLAKRQGTWFRSLGECRFLPMMEPADPRETAQRLATLATPARTPVPPQP
jgi:tRNA dimethylallyltransferase